MSPAENKNALNRLEPLSILRMLWKGKIRIVALWILVSVCGFLYVKRLPDTYEAEATVVVNSQKIPDRYVASTVNTDLQDRLASISQQILSATRLQKIMDDFGLYRQERRELSPEEVVELMFKAITIHAETRAFSGTHLGAFKVGFRGQDPNVVAAVANRISALYVEENLRARTFEAQGTEEFLENQLQDAKRSLDNLEAAVSKFKIEHNGELPQQQTEISATLARLQVALEANRDAISRAQQTKVTLENSLNLAEANLSGLSAALAVTHTDAEAAGRSSAAFVPNGSVLMAPRRSETIAHQIEELSMRYGPTHPDIRRLRSELAAAKAAEAKDDKAAASDGAPNPGSSGRPKQDEVAGAKPAGAPSKTGAQPATGAEQSRSSSLASISNDLQLAQARDRVNSVKTQIQFADKEIAQRNTEQAEILKQTAAYQARLQRLPVREQEMAQITRDYEIAKANYRSLLDKKLSAGMATAMEQREKAERFDVIDQAQVPSKPSKPNRKLLNAAVSLVGLALGLVVAVGLELKRDVVLGSWEIPARLPVLGSVPPIDVAAFSAEAGSHRGGRARLRWAIVCSIGLSVLLAIAAGAYVISHRY